MSGQQVNSWEESYPFGSMIYCHVAKQLTICYTSQAGFVEDAWHMLLDACRPQSPLFSLAVKAHEQYMRGRTKNIDYRAIMISIFGLETVKPLQTGVVTPPANGGQASS
jgi:hypothetical protein